MQITVPLLPLLLLIGAIGQLFVDKSAVNRVPTTTKATEVINIDEGVEPDINYRRIRIKMKNPQNDLEKKYRVEQFEQEQRNPQEEIEKNSVVFVKNPPIEYLKRPGWKYLYPANSQHQDSNVPTEHWPTENDQYGEQNLNYKMNLKLQPDHVNPDYTKEYKKTTDWRYQNPQYYEQQPEPMEPLVRTAMKNNYIEKTIEPADAIYPMRPKWNNQPAQKYTPYGEVENDRDGLGDDRVEQVNNNDNSRV